MEEVEQICSRIAILDHGRCIAEGTKEELKGMIKTGETVTVEAVPLKDAQLQELRELPHVYEVRYEEQVLTVLCTGAEHNLIRILQYLKEQELNFGRVFSELPTLNDVFWSLLENSFGIRGENSMIHLLKYSIRMKWKKF